jgi:hypothetical protein
MLQTGVRSAQNACGRNFGVAAAARSVEFHIKVLFQKHML